MEASIEEWAFFFMCVCVFKQALCGLIDLIDLAIVLLNTL